MMRNLYRLAAASAVSSLAAMAGQASASVLYSPAVDLVGDGGATTGAGLNNTDEIFLPNVAGQTTPVAASSYAGVGSGLITTNSTVEGSLSNNPGVADAAAAGTQYTGSYFLFNAGYTGSDGGVTTNGRTVGYMTATATSLTPGGATIVQSSATNRGAVSDANSGTPSNFWVAGSTTGYSYFNTPTQLATSPANTRTIQIRNGQLYGSSDTGSTYVGITIIGSGTPTSSGQTTTPLFNSGLGHSGTGSSSQVAPAQFVLIDNPNLPVESASIPYNTVYLADEGNSGNNSAGIGGIQKWVWSSSTATNNGWSFLYDISDGTNTGTAGGYFGLAGQMDPSTSSVYLWGTVAGTASGNALEQFSDPLSATTNTAADGSEITLATAPAGDFFRGVALAPLGVPEPATLGLMGLGALGLLGRRRRA